MLCNTQAIILAAGKSTRFNTGRSKLAEKLCGQEIILYPTKLFAELSIPTTIVVGFQQDLIKTIINQQPDLAVQFITQETQRGSWDALACTQQYWNEDHILVMNGDMPLVTQDIIIRLHKAHLEKSADISFVTAHYSEPSASYGRIVTKNGLTTIVEAREFFDDPHEYCCINAGIYLIKKTFLISQLNAIVPNTQSNEFYITDLIKNASIQRKNITTVTASFDLIRGVNTLEELWASEQIKRSELIRHWMNNGVRFTGAQNSHIDLSVKIGAGTVLEGGVKLRGNTVIGRGSYIGEFSSIENSTIKDNVTIYAHCVIKDSYIEQGAHVGPFAHLREHSIIKEDACIGNFVEIKNTTVGSCSKAKHLAYLGDAQIASNVNIGAGTITANYDGQQKQKTVIQDGAYVGCNTSIIAPVTIGPDSLIAAGSVIVENVPAEALAIARARQINKQGRAQQFNKRKKNEKENTHLDSLV